MEPFRHSATWSLSEINERLLEEVPSMLDRTVFVAYSEPDSPLFSEDAIHGLQENASQDIRLRNGSLQPSNSSTEIHPDKAEDEERVKASLLQRLLQRNDETGEQKKVVSSISVRDVAIGLIIHILPILITVTLLVLNAMTVYGFDDNSFANQNVLLQAFQFLVKGHEIMMAISISAVVLHRVRYDLITGEVPLGFLTSAYRLSDIFYLSSREFWGAAWTSQRNGRPFRRWTLTVLIMTACSLTLIVGPSSGVAMIPKLDWWTVQNPFGESAESYLINGATYDTLWPATITNETCGTWECPSAGAPEIAVQCIGGGGSFYRSVNSNSTNYTDGWTATTSVGMKYTSDLGSFWDYVVQYDLKPRVIRRPQLKPTLPNGQNILKPLVQIQCSAYPLSATTSDLAFPSDKLRGTKQGIYNEAHWPVPNSSHSVDNNATSSFAFVPMNGYTNSPTIGAVFQVIDENGTPIVAACSILAHWVPVHIWIDPRTDMNVHDNTPNPLDLFGYHVDHSKFVQLSFSQDWLDQLGSSNIPNILNTMVAYDNQRLRAGKEGILWRFSTILGLFITDGLARYRAHYTSIIIHHSYHSNSYALNLGILEMGPLLALAGFKNWDDYARGMLTWSVTVERYGYSWSFRGALIKFAAVVLVAQMLLAIGHIVFMVCGKWTSDAWGSVGSMMALALRSDGSGSESLVNTGAGIDKRKTWSSTIGLSVEKGDNLELVLGEAKYGCRAEPGRLYA